jgi:hypothetical protein
MPIRTHVLRNPTFWPTALMVAAMATLVQSFVTIKLVFLCLFLLAAATVACLSKPVPIYPRLMWFYVVLVVLGATWAMVGLANGNFVEGVTDAVRLYVVWSLAFVLLYSLLRSTSSLGALHAGIVLAGISIPALNLVGLADQLGGLGLMAASTREELQLYVGILDGYIRINSNNIGALFLIVPYLVSLQFHSEGTRKNTALTKISLALSLLLTAASGRRALWLVVGLTPLTILCLSFLGGIYPAMTVRRRRLLIAYCLSTVCAAGALAMFWSRVDDVGALQHLQAAFSAEDERTIQRGYLTDSFAEAPVLGSGFGAYAGYRRSEQRPWTYELTYHQMLFNIGLTGTSLLLCLFGFYSALVLGLIRRFRKTSATPFALLVGLCSLLIGAYSNPYLGSFDYLFFVGLLPYLSTFRGGFPSGREPVGIPVA